MAFKKVKTISTGVRLYYDSTTGDYEVRNQKSSLKRYIEGRGESVTYKNGVFQPGQSGSLTQTEIDDIQSSVYNIKKKIGVKAIANLPADYKQTEEDAFEAAKEWKNSQINDTPGQGEVINNSDIQNGSADTLLKSFGMLKYPIDADYGNTQDYMKITQRKYSPVRGGLFDGETNPFDYVNGVIRDNPAGEIINMVKLPIPNTLTDANSVAWGQDTMNAMSAGIAAAVSKVINEKNIDSLVNDFGGTLKKGVTAAGNALSPDNQQQMIENFRGVLTNPNMINAGTASLGSSVLNMLGQNMSAESILARGQGVLSLIHI